VSAAPTVRRPAVAGSFYPADPERLAELVDDLLYKGDDVENGDVGPPPKALIAPHAGYVWSGAVAATSYRRLRAAAARDPIGLVVVAGPAHFVPVDGVALCSARAFATPLGEVAVDESAYERALSLAGVQVDDAAHQREHSLEVQLPFLQRTLSRFTMLPLAVGRIEPEVLADVFDAVARGPDTVVIASSDLSHYLDQPVAEARDRRTAEAITAGNVEGIGPSDACGAAVLRGLLAWARRHRLRIRQLELRTSADAGGPPERVVGYGAFELTAANW
jgi:AmmeMemoRadiSam system protein B